METDETRAIGWRAQRIRSSRRKSLRVIAGLSGLSTTTLWRIEHGGHLARPDVHPEHALYAVSQVYYWVQYGRALAQLRGRRDDAVLALRTAEDIFPTKVRRDPIVREVITTLLPGAGRDAIGVELRGMAHRVGLTV